MLRTIRLTLLASILIYGFLCFRAPMRPGPGLILFEIIAILSVALVGAILFFRRNLVLRSETLLATQPDDRTTLARWRTGYIIIWALSEAIVLYGLVLRYRGFTFAHVTPFLIAGLVLMLFFSPRRPVEFR